MLTSRGAFEIMFAATEISTCIIVTEVLHITELLLAQVPPHACHAYAQNPDRGKMARSAAFKWVPHADPGLMLAVSDAFGSAATTAAVDATYSTADAKSLAKVLAERLGTPSASSGGKSQKPKGRHKAPTVKPGKSRKSGGYGIG